MLRAIERWSFFYGYSFVFLKRLNSHFLKTFYFFFLIIILFFVSCNDENSVSLEKINNDSLKFYFDKANDERLDFKSRHNAADSIKNIISIQTNDSLNRKNYFKLANRYFNMNAMDDYKKTTEIIIQILKKQKILLV